MGRELKRVPLDFNYPLKKVWEGYLNPYYKLSKNCADCDGSGESPDSKRLSDLWYANQHGIPFKPEDNGSVPFTPESPAVRQLAIKNTLMTVLGAPGREGFDKGVTAYWGMYKEGIVDSYVEAHPELESLIYLEGARLCYLFNGSWCYHLNELDVKALLDDGRLRDFTGYPRTDEQKVEYAAIEAWNNAERERRQGLPKEEWKEWKTFNNGYIPTPQEVNDWNINSMGHDSINSWVCVRARLKREKIRGRKCKTCKGHGTVWPNPEDKKKCSRWRQTEPPKGEGFQLWSTTNEGSPESPVFDTLEGLCEWCAENATTFASYTATKEAWMEMLDNNLVYHQAGNNIFL